LWFKRKRNHCHDSFLLARIFSKSWGFLKSPRAFTLSLI
jgi:hypothetical protein